MLVVHDQCQQRLAEAMNQAVSKNLVGQFASRLTYLHEYACNREPFAFNVNRTKCELYNDFAPFSFGFSMYQLKIMENGEREYVFWFNGGLIYHDGSGWEVHT